MVGCHVPLTLVPGSDANVVMSPIDPGAEYTSYTDQILYEIWKAILAGGGLSAMTKIISFDIGDGQAGTPINGATVLNVAALQGQNLFDANILVVKEGIALRYTSAATVKDIKRLNTPGVSGGFAFEAASGLKFETGVHYDIYIVGRNTAAAA